LKRAEFDIQVNSQYGSQLL